MKATSDKAPIELYSIEQVGTLADIKFFENVTEIIGNEGAHYEYDLYLLTAEWTENLESEIATSPDFWLKKAKESESKETVAVHTMEQMAIALLQTQTELEEVQTALDFLLIGGI